MAKSKKLYGVINLIDRTVTIHDKNSFQTASLTEDELKTVLDNDQMITIRAIDLSSDNPFIQYVEGNTAPLKDEPADKLRKLLELGNSVIKINTSTGFTFNPVDIDQARLVRKKMLSSSDWTQLPDAPLTKAQVTKYKTFRQALRDMFEGATDVSKLVWPEEPVI